VLVGDTTSVVGFQLANWLDRSTREMLTLCWQKPCLPAGTPHILPIRYPSVIFLSFELLLMFASTMSSVKVALSWLVGDGIGGFLSTDHQMCDVLNSVYQAYSWLISLNPV